MLVEVTSEYIPERSSPEASQYFYKYTVKLTNNSNMRLKLLKRAYKVRENVKEYKIEGSGVNGGEQPVIAPDEVYEFTSFCPLNAETGNIRGYYTFVADCGRIVEVEMPLTFFRR